MGPPQGRSGCEPSVERRDGGEARQASGEKAQRVDVVGVADGAGHVSLRSIFQPIFFFLFSISLLFFIKIGENGKILMRKKFKREVLKFFNFFYIQIRKKFEDKRKILMIEREF